MKIFLSALLCMMLCVPVFAGQNTTVLSSAVNYKNVSGAVPYIDGNEDVDMEKQANSVLNSKVRELADKVGNNAHVTYDIKLNRPSLLGILLKAEGNGKVAYQGVNIDLTTGREFVLGDFFVESSEVGAVLGSYKDILFADEGLYLRDSASGSYDKFVEYGKLAAHMRIGSAGRLVQVARLTHNAADKVLHIEKGNLMALKLDSNPSTGYRWDVVLDSNAQGCVQKVGSSFIMPREDDRTGVGGVEIIFLAAQKAGEYTVTMEYKRPWERQSINKFSFKVVVEE